MRDDDQRAPAVGAGGRSSSARRRRYGTRFKSVQFNGAEASASRVCETSVKSAHSYCTPDHMLNPTGQATVHKTEDVP